MCRLAAFPPGTTAEEAHEIVTAFVGGNDDGVGSAFVKDGEFVVKKYPYSYHEAIAKKNDLFDHMPYQGWTIAHVRLATHGGNEYKNTHPIIKGNLVGVHNGVFGAANLIRAAMNGSVKWQGDTDTEVALYILNKLGPEGFRKEMPYSAGVYLALGRDGALTAIKCSGDLRIWRTQDDRFILASSFKYDSKYWKDEKGVDDGILKLDKEGHALNFKFEKKEKYDYWNKNYRNTYGSGYTSSDIGYPSGMPPRNPTQSTGCNSSNSCSTPSKPKLELWDFPSEDELNKFYLENAK